MAALGYLVLVWFSLELIISKNLISFQQKFPYIEFFVWETFLFIYVYWFKVYFYFAKLIQIASPQERNKDKRQKKTFRIYETTPTFCQRTGWFTQL